MCIHVCALRTISIIIIIIIIIVIFSACLTILDSAVAKGHSVYPSVCHTRDPCLDGSRYQNPFHTICDNVSCFLIPNYIILNERIKEKYLHHPVESKNVTDNLQ